MVSVIMPTYNRAHFLTSTIESLLNQTHKELELIIIDDGSTDDTEAVIKAISDSRIKYYKYPHTGYVGIARNHGFKYAEGDIIAFADSDDMWDKDKLERQLQLMKEYPDAGFCITDIQNIREGVIVNHHTYKHVNKIEVANIFSRLRDNEFVVYSPSVIVKRYCIDETGFFNETIRSADFDFFIRLSHKYQAIVIYEPIVKRRLHDSNRSTLYNIQNYEDYLNTFRSLLEKKMIHEKHLQYAKWNAHCKVANIYLKRKEKKAAINNYRKALRYKPLNFSTYKLLASAYLSFNNE